jgi:flagellar motor switch protein FliM
MKLSTQSFETDAEFVQVLPGTEPAVVASFQVQIHDQVSFIKICYPYVLIDRLLGRTGIKQWLSQTTTPTEPAVRAKYEETLRGTTLRLQAELGRTRLSVADILSLGVGDVVPLDRRTQEPIDVRIGNRLQFRAHVGRTGNRHALKIVEQMEPELSEIPPSAETDAQA